MKLLDLRADAGVTKEEAIRIHTENCLAQNVLSDGFFMRPDGLYYIPVSPKAKVAWICQPFEVLGSTRRANGMGRGILLRFCDVDNNLRHCVLNLLDMRVAGGKVIGTLADSGFCVVFDQKLCKVLLEILHRWSCEQQFTLTDQAGWMAEEIAFVLPDGQVIGSQNIIFDGTAPGTPTTKGSLQEWKENVAAHCVENRLMTLAVSAAFAGPVLELFGFESGGLHFRGHSSSGKTTHLYLAQSVWSGSILRWRTTDNALENLAARHNNTVLCLDELGEMDGRAASDAIYMLGNGEGKQRRNAVGGLQQTHKWRQMILSSGEITMAEKLSEAGRTVQAGQEVRMLDIPADTQMFSVFDTLHDFPDGRSLSEALKSNAGDQHGTAGPAFVKAILADPTKARYDLKQMMMHFDRKVAQKRPGLKTGIIGRAQQRFALIAAAGELARAHGITGWQKGASIDAAIYCFDLWMSGQGANFIQPLQAAVHRLRQFTQRDDMIVDEATSNGSNGIIAWKTDDVLFVSAEGWAQIYGPHEGKKSAHLLLSNKILIPGDGRNIQSKTPTALSAPSRAYKIDLKALREFNGAQI